VRAPAKSWSITSSEISPSSGNSRHLAARFGDAVGLPPKAVGRLIRVAHAAQRVRAGDLLADIAYEGGYADQSHFNRDFRELVGCTPAEFPFVQDMPAAA
jgi:AraC-like DNA-binding protein